jgi:alpha-galactosidase
MTCEKRPGSNGFEQVDANSYAEWGVDFVKEDSCYADGTPKTAFLEYGKMRDALNATGRPMVFSLCGWHDWYAPEGASLGNSWRVFSDGANWPNVVGNINTMAHVYMYGGPGAWNDPDFLLGTSPTSAVHLTKDQSRSQFSLWCVMSAPLILSSSILKLNAWDLQTYSHKYLIEVNQDPSGVGRRIAGSDLVVGGKNPPADSQWNVWAKNVSSSLSGVVLVFFNVGSSPRDVICNAACILQTGINASGNIAVYDVWTGSKLGTLNVKTGWTAKAIKANGGSQTVVFVPVNVALPDLFLFE